MLATIDCTVIDERDDVVSTDSAILYLRRNAGLANILILSSGNESLIRIGGTWSYHAAEQLAREKGYAQFAWVNEDGSKGAGVLTGRNVFRPIVRRLTLVA